MAERFFALLALIAAAPLMAAIAVAIKVDSPGPILFRQQRIARRQGVGKSEAIETFTMYKFRSFHHQCENILPERSRFEFDPTTIGTVCLQLENDPRATRVGTWLRRTSLDELPNFINILKGEMGLVGPRPEVPAMLPYYSEEERIKFDVKPGLTGLAQVNGRGRLNFQETVAYDMDYVRRRSPSLNAKILLKTWKVVLRGDGSF